MRKRVVSVALACALAMSPVVGSIQMPVVANAATQTQRVMNFVDVRPGDRFYAQIKECYENGWVDGRRTRFDPDDNLTRGQAMKILGRFAGIQASQYFELEPFEDVPSDNGFAPYIAWGVSDELSVKITNGMGPDQRFFCPDKDVSRAQLIVFMYHYLQNLDMGGVELPVLEGRENLHFEDEGSFPRGTKNIIYAMAKAGVINGYGDGTFRANNTCTRGQACAFFSNFNKMLGMMRSAREDRSYIELENGKIGRVVSYEDLEVVTHYNNYLDRNTSTAQYAGGGYVYDGYFTILTEETLREIVANKKTVHLNMKSNSLDGYKNLLLYTTDIDLATSALKYLSLDYKGQPMNGLHLQYSKGYAGLNHNYAGMFAVVGDHLASTATLTVPSWEGSANVKVVNPGINDYVSWENVIGQDGSVRSTWDRVIKSWEPEKRGSSDAFQNIVVTYDAYAETNRDVNDEKYNSTYTIKANYYNSVTKKTTSLLGQNFKFKTEFKTVININKPSDYADKMKKFFPYKEMASGSFGNTNREKSTEENTPFWGTAQVTQDGIEIFLSEGASLYYRWKFNDLFYTRCYTVSFASSPETLDKTSQEEDYAMVVLGLEGYNIIQTAANNLQIRSKGSLPIADDKPVIIHFNCLEKNKVNQKARSIYMTGLPQYARPSTPTTVNLARVEGKSNWSTANADGVNKGYWYQIMTDFTVGNVFNTCTNPEHADCANYMGGGWLNPTFKPIS